MRALHLLKKYWNYVFDTRGFALDFDHLDGVSEHALKTAQQIRGTERGPAIILHGIMKRSGTVYVGDLLGLHPDLCQNPNLIWEVPFLNHTDVLLDFQERFFFDYQYNVDKIGKRDFLPLFGASLIAYLHSFAPAGQRVLVKVPSVEFLNYFYLEFPFEQLLVLVRDGRDVVASTLKTWPQLQFSDVCVRWNRSARMVIEFEKRHAQKKGYWFARFEDAVRDPAGFVAEACCRFNLDEQKYPYDEIASIPVQGSHQFQKDGRAEYWIPKPPGFNPVGRWQEWSGMQKAVFKRIAGRSLMELGYCESLDW